MNISLIGWSHLGSPIVKNIRQPCHMFSWPYDHLMIIFYVDVEFVFWQQEIWSNKGWKIYWLKRYRAQDSSSATQKLCHTQLKSSLRNTQVKKAWRGSEFWWHFKDKIIMTWRLRDWGWGPKWNSYCFASWWWYVGVDKKMAMKMKVWGRGRKCRLGLLLFSKPLFSPCSSSP